MKAMTSAEVRETFLSFFEEHGHRRVASSSLVPANDPTLLFTNSGMVQFKDAFLGLEHRDYSRATTSQKCMRVSGKHNDLEEVGPSPRHHTFFEMLGNFSFGGDYFKLEAMQFAYQLLTQVFEMPPDRLAFTIYEKDDESYDLWTKEIGIDPRRIARMGPKDNFWQMAETGPCGPNSEIFWDFHPERGIDSIIPDLQADSDRFIEVWNLVFMQFNRTQSDPEHTGQWDKPLPNPGVDTGMGLERVTSVLNGVSSNYETDLFMSIIEATQQLTGDSDEERDANIIPYRVIADHLRAAVFLISDSVLPGAKGRNAITRLVLRRAARFGKKLGFNEPFLGQIADAVIDVMGGHYTELVERAEYIKQAITQEEMRFLRTLERGLTELDAELDALEKDGRTQLPGKSAFYLKATLGLPIQVTKDIVEERGMTVDMAGFQAEEDRHSEISGGGQALGEIASVEDYARILDELQSEGLLGEEGVIYTPYAEPVIDDQIIALIQNGQRVEQVITGEKAELVMSTTPFYVEAGGQVSDTGIIRGDGWVFEVEDMRRPVPGLIVHVGEIVEGAPQVGDSAHGEVDMTRRTHITRNHTGTHLLHAALRNRLGTHVEQRGSLVAPDRLRFDFSHHEKVNKDALKDIETEVNEIILANFPVVAEEKSLKQAREEGAMALFGEKYGDRVRTIVIAQNGNRYSYELCGGIHVKETSEIGPFIIVSEGSVSAGIRRIEALTGQGALDYINRQIDTIHHVAAQLGTTPDNIVQRVATIQDELTTQRRHIERLQRDLARQKFSQMVEQIDHGNGVPTLIAQVDDVPMETLREMSDWFRSKVESGVMVIGSVVDDHPQLIVAVTDDLTKQGLHAGKLIKPIAGIIGGGGGGRPTMAQAGGKDSSKLPEALNQASRIIAENYQT
ncbi:MAG: alanine--tRNA ligase [Chloroflexi bacterium]|nr:MAG: alanine--tRNA ligase [Phototrophicales bacterium]RMF80577.1 MAG: alanine--tRNA ligase [Chloroflexota bacterium]